ncbi:helix-turn-helix domain-containing protein, partial [Planobispora siamensis]
MVDPSTIRTRADLCAALKRMVQADGRSYQDLAVAAEIGTATLHDMVNGKTFPRWDTLCRVLKACGVSTHQRLQAWRDAYVLARADKSIPSPAAADAPAETAGAPDQTLTGQIVEGDIPRRPRAFQPRTDLLEALRARMRQEGAAVIDAVTGMPGVGKSVLAASYAWDRQAAGWPLIIWISAHTPDQILTGLAGLARRLNLLSVDDDTPAAAAKARDWLAATAQQGLLVFDNATEVEALVPWCPATGTVQILITTRNRAFHALFEPIDVDVFTLQQSVDFLHQRTAITTEGADEVAEELGHLPLALGQAGALIARRRLSYPAYLTLLRDFPLSDYLPQAGGGYPDKTAQAILLSIDHAEHTIPGARELLELLAVLSEAGVPRAILYGTPDPDPASTTDLDQLLADLTDTSLISFSEDGTTVLMHRLTSRVLRERAQLPAAPEDLSGILIRATDLLHHFNTHILADTGAWAAHAAIDMLVEQTTTVYAHATGVGELTADLIALRSWCGLYLHRVVDLARAIPLLQQTLADAQ